MQAKTGKSFVRMHEVIMDQVKIATPKSPHSIAFISAIGLFASSVPGKHRQELAEAIQAKLDSRHWDQSAAARTMQQQLKGFRAQMVATVDDDGKTAAERSNGNGAHVSECQASQGLGGAVG